MNSQTTRITKKIINTPRLVCIVGPTAAGKTALAVQLARHFHTVVVSADSRQFYREMIIGTAKPAVEEQGGITHYFIDSHSIHQPISAGDYEREALALLNKLFVKHPMVILAGGSGLFVDAVCQGLDDLPGPLPGVRERLNDLLEEKGLAYLQEWLHRVDPQYYAEADIQNPQRVIRALEVFESTGSPFSFYRKKTSTPRNFHVIKIGINPDRNTLYERINARVDHMMQAGLLAEANYLRPHKHLPPLQTVGYSELFNYLDGNTTLDEAVIKIKQNTRRYAKRQITWFKKDKDTYWVDPDDTEAIITFVDSLIY
ncbi:tRNA dimethylallyltransferase [bacterium A37T11]|nr:tRNA dimethylallyltransferase [bacterium A37T11]